MYSAHIGGPYKMKTLMIAEEMRYSTLQVHGTGELLFKKKKYPFGFSVEINDLAVNIQMEVRLDKSNKDKTSILQGCSYRILQVSGFRCMHGKTESIVYGYLLNELPKVIRVHLKTILREALRPTTTTTPPPVTDQHGNSVLDGPAGECSEGNDDGVPQRTMPSNNNDDDEKPELLHAQKPVATDEMWTAN